MNTKVIPLCSGRCLLIIFLAALSPTLHADHKGKFDITFGGRIKIDAIYNTNSVSRDGTSKADLAFTPQTIPLADSGSSTDLNLRESRLWSTLRLPLANKSLASYIEFDFFDTRLKANGTRVVANRPRLRHLYANYGGLTLGKTFTNFINISAFPEINDANGPVGIHALRHELIRYRKTFDRFELSISAEDAESLFVTASGNRFRVNDDQIPDLTGRVNINGSWGELSLATMLRQVYANNRLNSNNDDKRWGSALSIAGRIYLQGKDNVRFTLTGGNALGRYVSYGLFDDAAIAADGRLDLNEIVSGHFSYQHWWSDRLRSSMVVGLGYANINTDFAGSNINKYVGSAAINLIWNPTLNSTIGVEWLHGYRQQYNQMDGNVDRIQLSLIYRVD